MMNSNGRKRFLSLWFFAAIGHLVTSIGLWWAGFLYGMRSFNESGTGAIAGFLFRIQTLLNFPVVFIEQDRLLRHLGRDANANEIWEHGIGPFPSTVSMAWSLLFGLLFAVIWIYTATFIARLTNQHKSPH